MTTFFDPKFDAKFGEFLVESGLISFQTLQEAVQLTKNAQRSLADVLCHDYRVDENAFYKLMSQKTGIPYVELDSQSVATDAIKRVPVKVASHYHFLPLRLENGELVVAVESPLSLKVQDEIRLQLGLGITQVLARRQGIADLFRQKYGFAADTVDRIISGSDMRDEREEPEISSIEDAGKTAGDTTVIDLVNEIIFEAFQKRATDIHFEPYRGEFRVRYRIDGILQDVNLPRSAKPILAFILSRIKIMANLDIIEKRLPQDGRAIVKIKKQTLDLRISSIPTLNGESIVIRILPTQMIFDLKKLGLTDKNITIFERLIKKPNGILLLTGPTGSGKTTTLYACLNRMNSADRKIITIEDPVEYEISGITQIPISPKAGLDFAKGLRSMLRHDPDVMMVGEIRDFETAEISIRAALTGHLVLSTLHTNDAASGITRLLDIGVEPFLVASSLEAIVAQRLVRRICVHCKTEDSSQPLAFAQKISRDLGHSSPADIRIFKGKGCEECGFTGFHGRIAIHEVLLVSEDIKRLIMKKASSQEIKDRAIAEGMRTLLQDGWQKVMAAQTTPGEVINAAAFEDSPEPLQEDPAAASLPSVSADSRIYQRMEMPLPVTYKVIKGHGGKRDVNLSDEYSGTAENFSASGLLMKSAEALELGDILDLHFKLSDAADRSVQCLARVVRLEESTESDGLPKAGLMYLDLSSADRAYLDHFILSKKTTVGGHA